MVEENCTYTYHVRITCDCCGALGIHEPSTTEAMSDIRERLRKRGWIFRYFFYLEHDQSHLALMALCGACLGTNRADWFLRSIRELEGKLDARS